MANAEHVHLAKQGREVIASWREEHPRETLDLREAYFSDVRLVGADLKGADLREADLLGADLSGADLTRANLGHTHLYRANLSGAVLANCNLTSANLYRSNLSGANLSRSNLTEANLAGTNLEGADLTRAKLYRANLTEARLNGADLTQANLFRANLNRADLSDATLLETDLYEAYLFRTVLDGTKFHQAVVGLTFFGDCDLSRAVGLEEVRHDSPSTVGIDTICRSQGMIPESFLLGTGAPEEFTNFQRSLAENPVSFCTSFIFCTNKDTAVAQKLCDDLKHRGVRCWVSTVDMSADSSTEDQIDRAVCYYEKVMILCSADGLDSEVLRGEMTQAIQRQEAQGKWIYFPVVIDDAVYERQTRFVRQVRQHVLFDIRNREDSQAYGQALDRLVQELNRDQEASAGIVPQQDED